MVFFLFFILYAYLYRTADLSGFQEYALYPNRYYYYYYYYLLVSSAASGQERQQAIQIFTSSAASGILTNDLVKIMECAKVLSAELWPCRWVSMTQLRSSNRRRYYVCDSLLLCQILLRLHASIPG